MDLKDFNDLLDTIKVNVVEDLEDEGLKLELNNILVTAREDLERDLWRNNLDHDHWRNYELELRWLDRDDFFEGVLDEFKEWSPVPDKSFSGQFLAQFNKTQTAPSQPGSPSLCDRCMRIKLPLDGSEVSFNTSEIRILSQTCQLCAMISQLLGSSTKRDGSVMLRRNGSMLGLGDRSQPGLTIVAASGAGQVPQDIQIGFPVLPEVGGSTHFTLLREWLRACNERGECYKNYKQLRLLPTRVLDVGDQKNQRLLLHETGDTEKGRYIALSHRWGNPTEAEKAKFCTYACNIEERKRGINFDDLPKNFRDAVTVARELGVQYLWIDSMCIVQPHQECDRGNCGPKSGDWNTQAEKMEQYYSSAYCTVAADSAQGPNGGLFQSRRDRQCVRLPNPQNTAIYLCEAIDDFDRDVDKGVLNQRGWVFQERALSCRTIHYTNTQTYWECGCGIRCETLGALRPPLSYRLHDPQFPRSKPSLSNLLRDRLDDPQLPPSEPLSSNSGRKIFKFAFQQYSRLSLTECSDRSIAISGVVKRLENTLGTAQTYGIFHEYLQESLLWRRCGEKRSLERKTLPAIPSWSWMAYEGSIEYISIGTWFKGGQISFLPVGNSQSGAGLCMELREPGRKINWEDVNEDGQQLTFDGHDPNGTNSTYDQQLKLAVIGWEQQAEGNEDWSYVLVVRPCSEGGVYERVGVGHVQGKHMLGVSMGMVRII